MADDTKNATLRSVLKLGTYAAKAERAATVLDSTVEVAAGASTGSTYTFARIPTDARIHGTSRIAGDILDATANTPTLDLGFKAVDGNFTTSVTALNDGIDLSGTAFDVRLLKDIATSGKMVWEILGLTSDPGGLADVTGTILDFAAAAGGTLTLTLVYSVD